MGCRALTVPFTDKFTETDPAVLHYFTRFISGETGRSGSFAVSGDME